MATADLTVDSKLAQQLDENLAEYCLTTATAARAASQILPLASTTAKNDYLHHAANQLVAATDQIIAANAKDLANAASYGLTAAEVDRLRLDEKRVAAIAAGIAGVAALPDPVGEVLESFRRPNNLQISKVRVPLGVVFFIYESRPNVTADAAAICLKSGNAVILRGGKEAIYSSQQIVAVMRESLTQFGLPSEAIALVETTDRAAVGHFLAMDTLIDVTIPRGGKGLIERVASEARMPVIKHLDGVCHVYVHQSADPSMALAIIENSKCQRMGVCNAMETLLVDRSIAAEFLPTLVAALKPHQLTYHADAEAIKFLPNAHPAIEATWSTEWLGPSMSVKVVEDVTAAIAHVNRYGSHHSDAIIGNDYAAIERFTAAVDSAAVLVNASTRFNDGGEFGFGAEIGISTDKFHARGPCGLRELTSYKYIVRGSGQIRE